MPGKIKIREKEFDLDLGNIVILGTNGSGKSTVGVQLAGQGCERISANRTMTIAESISITDLNTADLAFKKQQKNTKGTRNVQSTDFDLVLRRLISEHASKTFEIQKQIVSGEKNRFEISEA